MAKSLTMDFSEFNKKFDKLNREVTGKLEEKGMFRALSALKHDAENVVPTVPKKIGTLRSEVEFDIKVQGKKSVEGTIIYTMPYATRLHEAPESWNFSEPGSGPKFLLSKLIVYGKKYRDIIGAYIKRNLR